MKTIRTKILSLLLALVTILSLLPTSAFAASQTGSGIQITQNQAYWSTRLLANGTPYSYRPPLVDGKLVYCILCFDIQDLGENLKSVGLLVMLDAIYNRVIQNRKAGKYTHVYIDEIYLFFANGSGSGHSITNYSSEFLYKCWKRFRKYGATLTGITQNVEECLLSNTARMMFANSEFLLMLNQATTDREQLARLLGASDTQMSYVDNAPAGHGLIKVGGAIVPISNELPKNTELYRLMSTKPGED